MYAADSEYRQAAAAICRGEMREVSMPLSEREQQLFDQIERGLGVEDTQHAQAVRPALVRSGVQRFAITVFAGVTVGMALVLAGLIAEIVILAIVGFLVIVAAVAYATTKLPVLKPAEEHQLPFRHRSRQ